jgi:hypothetical protein
MSAGSVKLVTGLAGNLATKTPLLSKAGLKNATLRLKNAGVGASLAADGAGGLTSAIRAPKVAKELTRTERRDG